MEPHPLLTAHYESAEAKPVFVDGLFDAGAEYYDAIVDWGFLKTGAHYRRWAQKRHGLRPGHDLLDVACGTGLMATAAAQLCGGAQGITCVDPSAGMLAIARRKLDARFVQARAEALPLPEASFDFLTMGYALRHVTQLEATFGEFYRVLRPGGRVLLLEVTKPGNRIGAFAFDLYFGRVYPGLTRMFTGSRAARDMMRYFWETMDACVRPETVLAALRGAGFTDVRLTRLAGLFSEYSAAKL
jgi:demethylmenaquinone methyltransferase / 2-methoxy-6-polyprenyl-1,4-benzoquinol methylase